MLALTLAAHIALALVLAMLACTLYTPTVRPVALTAGETTRAAHVIARTQSHATYRERYSLACKVLREDNARAKRPTIGELASRPFVSDAAHRWTTRALTAAYLVALVSL